MNKTTTTKIVLYGNAVVLILGTIAQNFDNPAKGVVLSCLFIAWAAMLGWHVYSALNSESAE